MTRRFLGLLALLSACHTDATPDDSSAGNDAAVSAETGTHADSGQIEFMVPDGGSLLFGYCRTDADCADGATCLGPDKGFPGGYCTRNCASTRDCDTGRESVIPICRAILPGSMQKMCARACTNGYDCGREGVFCHVASATVAYCAPACTETSCGPGFACDPYTGFCGTAPTPAHTGGNNGAPCDAGTDCKSGTCIAGRSASGAYNGFNNGLCVSGCSLPDGYTVTSVYPTDRLPRGNCPSDSVCFPDLFSPVMNGPEFSAQSEGVCLDECTTDTDCRQSDGYFCQKSWNFGRSRHPYVGTNGVCFVLDCNVSGVVCPSGYTCINRGTADNAQYRCLPSPIDAGVAPDGAMEASVPRPEAGMLDVAVPPVDVVAVPDVQLPVDVLAVPDVQPIVDAPVTVDAPDDAATGLDAATAD